MDRRADGNSRSEFQKFSTVAAGRVGYTPDALFVIKMATIIERRRGGHVDSRQNHRTALFEHAQSLGDDRSGGGENDRPVDLGRGSIFRGAHPSGPEPAGQPAVGFAASKDVDLAAVKRRHLNGDVGGASESIETQPLSAFDTA